MNLLTNITQYSRNVLPALPETIEEVTYASYEGSNPFRNTFNDIDIKDENMKQVATSTKAIGSEVFSAFTNPFYLTHKIIQLPTYYKTIIETYGKNSKPAEK